jgi:hypothetical protein
MHAQVVHEVSRLKNLARLVDYMVGGCCFSHISIYAIPSPMRQYLCYPISHTAPHQCHTGIQQVHSCIHLSGGQLCRVLISVASAFISRKTAFT